MLLFMAVLELFEPPPVLYSHFTSSLSLWVELLRPRPRAVCCVFVPGHSGALRLEPDRYESNTSALHFRILKLFYFISNFQNMKQNIYRHPYYLYFITSISLKNVFLFMRHNVKGMSTYISDSTIIFKISRLFLA